MPDLYIFINIYTFVGNTKKKKIRESEREREGEGKKARDSNIHINSSNNKPPMHRKCVKMHLKSGERAREIDRKRQRWKGKRKKRIGHMTCAWHVWQDPENATTTTSPTPTIPIIQKIYIFIYVYIPFAYHGMM